MTDFLILDVFTDAPFTGNPLAVIPDATGLSEDSLQRIAREFNFSESTFVYPPEDPAHTARVRIFAPATELPFAGHPTIGTAIALAAAGHGPDMVLELGVGPIPVSVRDGKAQFTTPVPLFRGVRPEYRRVDGLSGSCARRHPDRDPCAADGGCRADLLHGRACGHGRAVADHARSFGLPEGGGYL